MSRNSLTPPRIPRPEAIRPASRKRPTYVSVSSMAKRCFSSFLITKWRMSIGSWCASWRSVSTPLRGWNARRLYACKLREKSCMAKFARPEDKSFSPLNLKLIEEATEPTLPPPEPSKPPAPRQTKDTRTKVVALMTGVENHQPRALESVQALEIETAEDQLTESMRYRVSRVERREIEKFVQRLSNASNVNLTHNNIMRACRDILFQAEGRIVRVFE